MINTSDVAFEVQLIVTVILYQEVQTRVWCWLAMHDLFL